MSITYWVLLALLLLAAGLVIWADRTAEPGPDWRHETVRAPRRHSQRNRDQATQRLRPASPDWQWLPPRERPGGEAQRLPGRDDLPWRPEELRSRPGSEHGT